MSYSYDGVGNRTLMSDGEGRRTTYTYLSTPYTNAIVDIQPPYEAVKTRVSWYELYKSTFRFLNNGTASTEYQITRDNGWETARTHFSGAGSQGAYSVPSYDAAGNRLQMGESNAGGPTTLTHFTYDQTNQLLSERRVDTPGYANTWTYDGTGNRLTQNALGIRTTYQYGSGNRLLSEQTGADTTNYSYDENGNLTLIDAAGQLTTHTWNTDNRLTKVENPDGSVEEMAYGADGRRRKKTVTPLSGPASDTIFVYDGQNLMQERDGSGLIVANYTWGPDRLNTGAGQNWAAGNIGDTVLLQRRATTPGDLANGTTHYFGTDPSANIRLLIDPSGNVADRMTYEAFGAIFAGSGGILTPFRFGGSLGYFFDAFGRYDVGYRIYDDKTGRWMSLDPIGFDGGLWNLYGYVGNNPVVKTDPTGRLIVSKPSESGCTSECIRKIQEAIRLALRVLPYGACSCNFKKYEFPRLDGPGYPSSQVFQSGKGPTVRCLKNDEKYSELVSDKYKCANNRGKAPSPNNLWVGGFHNCSVAPNTIWICSSACAIYSAKRLANVIIHETLHYLECKNKINVGAEGPAYAAGDACYDQLTKLGVK